MSNERFLGRARLHNKKVRTHVSHVRFTSLQVMVSWCMFGFKFSVPNVL